MKLGKKVNYYLLLLSISFIVSSHSSANSDTYLAIGQVTHLSFSTSSRFILSNNAVLAVKVLPQQEKILIKAKSEGMAQVTIINPNKVDVKHNFFVSKEKFTKSLEGVLAPLQANSIPFKKMGRKRVHLQRELDNLDEYQLVTSLKKQSAPHVTIQGEVSNELKNQILSEVYFEFLANEITSINCQSIDLEFLCTYFHQERGVESLIQKFSDQYNIRFQKTQFATEQDGLILKVKLIQVEFSKSTHKNPGINNLNLSIDNLIKRNFSELTGGKTISLNDHGVSLNVVAEPEVNIVLNEKASFKIGSEIPFSEKDKNGEQTQSWKFFGINVDIMTKKIGSIYKSNYSFTLSSPPVSGMSTINSSKSTSYLKLNSPSELFNFKLEMNSKSIHSIPYLNAIPFLARLFESNDRAIVSKKIIAIATIEKRTP